MSVIYRYVVILLCTFVGVTVVASDKKKVDVFLQDLFKKSKSLKKSKGTVISLQKEQLFFSDLKRQTVEAKQQEKKQAVEEEQKEVDYLHYMIHFYGNPKYHAAMDILNNTTLQEAYQQNINQIQMSLFDYSEKIIKKYHTSQRMDKDDQQTISSWLSSLQSVSQKSKNSSKKEVMLGDQQSVQKVASFLSTLKG